MKINWKKVQIFIIGWGVGQMTMFFLLLPFIKRLTEEIK